MTAHPGFYFCICPDADLAKDQVRLLLRQHFGEQTQKWNQAVFWADDGLESNFWQALSVQNLFGTGQVIILRNAQLLLADDWKKLNKALSVVTPGVWLFIFMEVAFEKGQAKIPAHVKRLKCFEFATSKGWVWSAEGLGGKELRAYVQSKLDALGLEASSELFKELLTVLPAEAGAINLELEKLALSLEKGQKQLDKSVLALLGQDPEIDVFKLLRHVQAGGRADEVWAIILTSHTKDKILFPFLGALLREARILWQLLFGENVYLPGSLLAEKKALARQLGVRALGQLWDMALSAEQGLKSGSLSEEQALERLVSELFGLFSPRQA